MKTDETHHTRAAFGLCHDPEGFLHINGHRLTDIAGTYGTPLHVVHRERLRRTALNFLARALAHIPARVSVHYAFKCNPVPGVLSELREAGLNAEVMSPVEYHCARSLGYLAQEVIVNGPAKSDGFLRTCIEDGVRAICVDSLEELDRIDVIARSLGEIPTILLRVNPDLSLRGSLRGNATGRRSSSVFGLDLAGGEVERALATMATRRVRFDGFSVHIGTNIQRPVLYRRSVEAIAHLVRQARRLGFPSATIDLGGGFPSPTARAFSPVEMLTSELLNAHPQPTAPGGSVDAFLDAIGGELRRHFSSDDMPAVILEPGRSITSNAQFLLLTVQNVKRRKGLAPWVVTDGGLGTVTLPTYYESHAILPCRQDDARMEEPATILGPGCFAGDIVAKNRRLPIPDIGDVLAVMDSGAYFTSLESTFGYPRPAVVSVDHDGFSVLRRHECFEDIFARDVHGVDPTCIVRR